MCNLTIGKSFLLASSNNSLFKDSILCLEISSSRWDNSSYWFKNHKSIFVISWILLIDIFFYCIIYDKYPIQMGILIIILLSRNLCTFSILPRAHYVLFPILGSFVWASWNDLPIAITSPTAFIINPTVLLSPQTYQNSILEFLQLRNLVLVRIMQRLILLFDYLIHQVNNLSLICLQL